MTKKLTALGLILCLMLGGIVGFAEEDTQSDALENALAYMKDADSLTIDAQFAIRQNGDDHVTGDVVFQAASERMYMSSSVLHPDGETREMETSIADGTRVTRVGDEFYSMPIDTKDEDEAEETVAETEPAKEPSETMANSTQAYMETVMDQLFGSVTDQMTMSETGLSLHLSGDEVPAILNLAVSMAGGFMQADTDADATSSATSDMPIILHGTRGGETEAAEVEPAPTSYKLSLGSNLHIDRIDLDVAIEANVVSGIQCSIVLSGIDEDGAVVETELAAVVRVIEVNSTEPQTIDLTGVDMQPIEKGRRHNRRGL